MCFVARKLGLDNFRACLQGPIVSSWLQAGKWDQRPVREALPLPLFVVCELEQAVATGPDEDRWLISCSLLMIWCSLRFSDAQRIDLSTVYFARLVLALKTRATGFAWGCWCCGATGLEWANTFVKTVSQPGLFDGRQSWPFTLLVCLGSAPPLPSRLHFS